MGSPGEARGMTARMVLAKLTRINSEGTEWRSCRKCGEAPQLLVAESVDRLVEIWRCHTCGWEVRL